MSEETEMEKESNIVKRVCKELDITQKELAEMLEVHLTTVQKWVASEELPKNVEKSVELLLENKQLKERLYKFETAFRLIEEARGS
jgi:DNA-binding transcriptional regulator YiaG